MLTSSATVPCASQRLSPDALRGEYLATIQSHIFKSRQHFGQTIAEDFVITDCEYVEFRIFSPVTGAQGSGERSSRLDGPGRRGPSVMISRRESSCDWPELGITTWSSLTDILRGCHPQLSPSSGPRHPVIRAEC